MRYCKIGECCLASQFSFYSWAYMMILTKGSPDGALAQLSLVNGDVHAAASCVPVFVNNE